MMRNYWGSDIRAPKQKGDCPFPSGDGASLFCISPFFVYSLILFWSDFPGQYNQCVMVLESSDKEFEYSSQATRQSAVRRHTTAPVIFLTPQPVLGKLWAHPVETGIWCLWPPLLFPTGLVQNLKLFHWEGAVDQLSIKPSMTISSSGIDLS